MEINVLCVGIFGSAHFAQEARFKLTASCRYVKNYADFMNDSFGKSVFWERVSAVCAAVCVLPMLFFLFRGLAESPQLRDAVVILVSALAVLAVEHRIHPHKPKFGRAVVDFLAAGYCFLLAAHLAIRPNIPLLDEWTSVFFAYFAFVLCMFAGFAFFIAAVGSAFFDSKRYVYAASGGFFAFSILSVLFQFADLPLRILAGRVAGRILAAFCDSVSVIFYGGEIPQIALKISGKSYLVATECNGFGIISACAVLAVVMAVFGKMSVRRRVGALLAGIFVGLAANTLRIVCIIAVSLAAGDKYYYFFHEAIGYAFFGAALVAVYKICAARPKNGESAKNSSKM